MAESLLSLTELSPGAPDRWYLLESTATLEVDRPESQSAPPDLENQIRQLVKTVLASNEESPHLVLFSHGYSNDRPAVLARINKARKVTSGPDLAPSGTFYVGYGWPSERIFTPFRSLFTGLASLLWLTLILGLFLLRTAHLGTSSLRSEPIATLMQLLVVFFALSSHQPILHPNHQRNGPLTSETSTISACF